MTPSTIAIIALASGVAGYAIENAVVGPRHSRWFPDLPFMPVYAVGGAAVALLAPELRDQSVLVKALSYGVALTAVEGAAGLADRATGGRSWDYDGHVIDLPHALLWAGMGLGLDGALRMGQAGG